MTNAYVRDRVRSNYGHGRDRGCDRGCDRGHGVRSSLAFLSILSLFKCPR